MPVSWGTCRVGQKSGDRNATRSGIEGCAALFEDAGGLGSAGKALHGPASRSQLRLSPA
jgi:hypothetical protein